MGEFIETDIKCCRCGGETEIFEDGHCYCIPCYGIIHPLDVELNREDGQ